MNPENEIGVYRIVAPSGSCYIGATAVSFESRWKGHRKDFRIGKMKCQGLRRAFLKYGIENMRFEILEIVDSSDAETVWTLERFWWNRIKAQGVSIYNGEPTGTGSVFHTEETRAKISSALTKDPLIKTCAYEHCGAEFTTKKLNVRFCSISCSAAVSNAPRRRDYDRDYIHDLYWTQKMSRNQIMALLDLSVGGFQNLFSRLNIPMRTKAEAAAISNTVKLQEKVCLEESCGIAFQPKKSSQKYCSRECADRNRKVKSKETL